MTKNVGTDRADDDAYAVNTDRRRNGRKARQFEEHVAPDGRRDHAGDQEVVLLDHRTDDTRQRDLIDLIVVRACRAKLFPATVIHKISPTAPEAFRCSRTERHPNQTLRPAAAHAEAMQPTASR